MLELSEIYLLDVIFVSVQSFKLQTLINMVNISKALLASTYEISRKLNYCVSGFLIGSLNLSYQLIYHMT